VGRARDWPSRRAGATPAACGRPYMAHLLGVASLVLEDGGDKDEVVAAVLHDAVEDRGGRPRLDDIRARFGARIAGIVESCSDAVMEPGEEKGEWFPRKVAYIRRLRCIDNGDETAVLRVTMADKLYNLRATVRDARPEETRDAFWRQVFTNTGAAGQLWYYRALRDVYQERRAGSILFSELHSLVDQLDALVPEGAREKAAEYAQTYSTDGEC
jgi:(p)ppGpp synthase/HD superfamily hydrolase